MASYLTTSAQILEPWMTRSELWQPGSLPPRGRKSLKSSSLFKNQQKQVEKMTELGITETELPLPKISINYRITATEVLKLPRPITAPKCWLPCPPLQNSNKFEISIMLKLNFIKLSNSSKIYETLHNKTIHKFRQNIKSHRSHNS